MTCAKQMPVVGAKRPYTEACAMSPRNSIHHDKRQLNYHAYVPQPAEPLADNWPRSIADGDIPRFVMTGGVLWDNELQCHWIKEEEPLMKRARFRAQGQLKVFASFTQQYGSGKVAFDRGDPLLLIFSGAGTTWVYPATATAQAIKHGIGLLYTYDGSTAIEIDGKL